MSGRDLERYLAQREEATGPDLVDVARRILAAVSLIDADLVDDAVAELIAIAEELERA